MNAKFNYTLWFVTSWYQNDTSSTSLTSFNDAPTLSITFYLYNMFSNGDSHGVVANGSTTLWIKNGNCTNATHQHRMQQMKQQMMHNGNNNN
jgi:hypothetical protein